jgi:ParB family transcriptional regulator, chromosome partitioning protein
MSHTVTRTEQLDPRTLLVDVNVRTDLQLDKQFVATIRDHGVLVPIVAIDTPDGVRVRSGTAGPWPPSKRVWTPCQC